MEDAERKLELTRYLRQEQNLNRMKVKNREDILYGTGKNSEMLYGDDGLESGSRGIRGLCLGCGWQSA